MNVIIGLISIILCFSAVVLIEKIFKKEGLYVWVAISVIIANIAICKQVNFFGFATSLGSVAFASSFLATDILSIKYGKDVAKKAVILGLVSVVTYVIATNIILLFKPNEIDFMNESMKALFTFGGRVSIASIFMYFVSNLADVYLFDKLVNKFPKQLWIGNNVSTIVCNVGENILFGLLAFGGVFPVITILKMTIVGSIIEVILALCDTPFLYLSKNLK